jgi:hypothetical protein
MLFWKKSLKNNELGKNEYTEITVHSFFYFVSYWQGFPALFLKANQIASAACKCCRGVGCPHII